MHAFRKTKRNARNQNAKVVHKLRAAGKDSRRVSPKEPPHDTRWEGIPTALWYILVLVLLIPGCATPTATVDLIGVAKKSLASAAASQQQSHELIVKQYQARQSALDSAFDADVRLAAAGELKNAKDEPIPLSADWVISARKGYAAARDLLDEQIRKETETHAVEQDNLAAAVEALKMAEELTVLQWNVGERFKQQFLKLTQKKEADNGK